MSRFVLLGCVVSLLRCGPNLVVSPQLCANLDVAQWAAPDVPRGPAGLVAYAHAHNDYEHRAPLTEALANNFHSVEADIFFQGGDLMVSHWGLFSKGSLRQLYLDPLQARVDAHPDSVLGDGQPFYLWIDIKDGTAGLQRLLLQQLSAYPMLTRFGAAAKSGAVTVVLTGDDGAKEALVAAGGTRPFVRDGPFRTTDPAADDRWQYYGLAYPDYIGGTGLDDKAVARIRCLVALAHSKGRKIRLYDAPDNALYWKMAAENGMDFINTDLLEALNHALSAQGAAAKTGALPRP